MDGGKDRFFGIVDILLCSYLGIDPNVAYLLVMDYKENKKPWYHLEPLDIAKTLARQALQKKKPKGFKGKWKPKKVKLPFVSWQKYLDLISSEVL